MLNLSNKAHKKETANPKTENMSKWFNVTFKEANIVNPFRDDDDVAAVGHIFKTSENERIRHLYETAQKTVKALWKFNRLQFADDDRIGDFVDADDYGVPDKDKTFYGETNTILWEAGFRLRETQISGRRNDECACGRCFDCKISCALVPLETCKAFVKYVDQKWDCAFHDRKVGRCIGYMEEWLSDDPVPEWRRDTGTVRSIAKFKEPEPESESDDEQLPVVVHVAKKQRVDNNDIPEAVAVFTMEEHSEMGDEEPFSTQEEVQKIIKESEDRELLKKKKAAMENPYKRKTVSP